MISYDLDSFSEDEYFSNMNTRMKITTYVACIYYCCRAVNASEILAYHITSCCMGLPSVDQRMEMRCDSYSY